METVWNREPNPENGTRSLDQHVSVAMQASSCFPGFMLAHFLKQPSEIRSFTCCVIASRTGNVLQEVSQQFTEQKYSIETMKRKLNQPMEALEAASTVTARRATRRMTRSRRANILESREIILKTEKA